MTRRRSAGERAAPWVLMAVLVALWWAGATLLQWTGLVRRPPAIATPDAPAGEATQPRTPTLPPAAAPTGNVGPVEDPPEPTPPPDRVDREPEPPSTGDAVASELPEATLADLDMLRARNLTIPVQGTAAATLTPTFGDPRSGERVHEALDIVAPRGTPVLAVEDGTLAKLFTSDRGGLTLYQFDPGRQFVFYYAHLDAYVEGLREGEPITRGQVLGYVGTTGNAPPDTPHLHFAIFKLGPERVWYKGTPVDPYLVWRPQ